MKMQSYKILLDLLNDFKQEKNKVDREIQDNLLKMEKNRLFILSMIDSSDNESEIFNPRNNKEQLKSEIEKIRVKEENCIKENEINYHLLSKLENYISMIQFVINSDGMKEQNNEDTNEEVEIFSQQHNLIALEVQEEERRRIARELHDTSLQNITHIMHKVELSSMFIDQDPVKAKLELALVNKNLRSIVEEIRDIIFDLRPMTFDDLGIKNSLERLLSKLNEHNQFEVEMDLEEIVCSNDLILVSIYRIIQECVSNSVKHSGGSKIYISMKSKNNECEVIVQDNGKGFTESEVLTKKEKHFGLTVVSERVKLLRGKLKFETGKENGTKVVFTVPIE